MGNDTEPEKNAEEQDEIAFLDELTAESLVASAIWEQIELHRRRGGTSPSEDPNQSMPIDPRFQSDYNNL